MGVIHRDIALVEFTDQRLGQPFGWGENDCNILALEWADLLRDAHYADEIRGRYHSERSAVKFQKRHGVRVSGLLEQWGAVRVMRGFERIGDIVIAAAAAFDYCHIVAGRRLLSSGPDFGGVCLLPFVIEQEYTTWRLP